MISSLIAAILHFTYPPFCLRCGMKIQKNGLLFCQNCVVFFELVEPSDHCATCFGMGVCDVRCQQFKRESIKIASCFAYIEGVRNFVKALKGQKIPYLAKTMACLLAVQWERLGWPLPDLIIPVASRPLLPFFPLFARRSYLTLVARYLSRILGCRAAQPVRRVDGRIQKRLTRRSRLQLTPQSFVLKKGVNLKGKHLLVIDDVMTTKRTIECTCLALRRQAPATLSALSLSFTI